MTFPNYSAVIFIYFVGGIVSPVGTGDIPELNPQIILRIDLSSPGFLEGLSLVVFGKWVQTRKPRLKYGQGLRRTFFAIAFS